VSLHFTVPQRVAQAVEVIETLVMEVSTSDRPTPGGVSGTLTLAVYCPEGHRMPIQSRQSEYCAASEASQAAESIRNLWAERMGTTLGTEQYRNTPAFLIYIQT